jgi:hypothetical protein
MKNIFALLGLIKYALANVYMSRDERRRVHRQPRKVYLASALRAAGSSLGSLALALASDARAICILCSIGMRNFLRDARVAVARGRSQD